MDIIRSSPGEVLEFAASSTQGAATPVSKDTDAKLRILQLGLTWEALLESLGDGVSAFRSTTRDHPPSYPGQRMWAETTASLRRNLAILGWESEDVSNVALVVNRDKGNALIVTAGDGGVGNEKYRPQVRYERRDVIQRLVNGELDSLFAPGRRPDWEVWFLLHTVTQRSVAAELSRPIGIAMDGLVSDWSERILLPLDLHQPDVSQQVDVPDEITIDVQRRSG